MAIRLGGAKRRSRWMGRQTQFNQNLEKNTVRGRPVITNSAGAQKIGITFEDVLKYST